MERRIRARNVIIISFTIGILLGLIVGALIAGTYAINFCVNTGMKLLKEKKVDLEIDTTLLKQGIMMYKTNIQSWLNIENNKINSSA